MKKILACAVVLCASAASFNVSAGGNIQAGKALVEKFNCAMCHGADYNKPAMDGVPKLAGQFEDYLANTLKQYRRADGANGRANQIMVGQVNRPGADGKVVSLTNKEIQDIAAYLHSLPGSLVQK